MALGPNGSLGFPFVNATGTGWSDHLSFQRIPFLDGDHPGEARKTSGQSQIDRDLYSQYDNPTANRVCPAPFSLPVNSP